MKMIKHGWTMKYAKYLLQEMFITTNTNGENLCLSPGIRHET